MQKTNAAIAILIGFLILFYTPLQGQQASEISIEPVKEWKTNVNLYGSPSGYSYFARYRHIDVFDSDQNEVLSRRMKGNEKVYASPMGNFWGAASLIDRTAGAYTVTKFTVYNHEGKSLYTINQPDVLKFVLNDASSNIVGVRGTEGLPVNALKFYDNSGKFLRERTITNYTSGFFAAEGNLYFAHSTDSGMYVFNNAGEEQYRIWCGRNFDVSEDGRVIVALTGSNLELFFLKNKTNFKTVDFGAPRQILISDDSRSVLVMTKDQAICYGIPELEELWRHKVDNVNHQFSSCDHDSRSGLYAFGIAIDGGADMPFGDRFNQGRVELLDQNGKLVRFGSLEYDSWSRGFPRVIFSQDGNPLWILSHYGLFRMNY